MKEYNLAWRRKLICPGFLIENNNSGTSNKQKKILKTELLIIFWFT